jgi:hypothetical protein
MRLGDGVCIALLRHADDACFGKRLIAAELRIHDEIERGDNDSIKVGGKNVKVDKPCSSSS